jgi:HEAT repeat protein
MRAAVALLKTNPNHQPSQATLADGIARDPAWISEVVALIPPPTWAVTALIGLVEHQEAVTRRLAADGLGKLSAADPISQAVLDQATRDRDAGVRRAAETALKRIRSGG